MPDRIDTATTHRRSHRPPLPPKKELQGKNGHRTAVHHENQPPCESQFHSLDHERQWLAGSQVVLRRPVVDVIFILVRIDLAASFTQIFYLCETPGTCRAGSDLITTTSSTAVIGFPNLAISKQTKDRNVHHQE